MACRQRAFLVANCKGSQAHNTNTSPVKSARRALRKPSASCAALLPVLAGRHETLSADAHNAKFSSLIPKVPRKIQSFWPVLWLSAGRVVLVPADFSPRTPCWHKSCCCECVQPHRSCCQLEDACQCCLLVFFLRVAYLGRSASC